MKEFCPQKKTLEGFYFEMPGSSQGFYPLKGSFSFLLPLSHLEDLLLGLLIIEYGLDLLYMKSVLR